MENKKKTSIKIKAFDALLIFGLVLGISLIAYGQFPCTESESISENTGHLVQYKVLGSAEKATLTFINEDEGTSQRTAYSLPTTEALIAKISDGQFLYISAQNQTEYGSIEVQIIIDDKIVKSASSSGPYCIASVDCIASDPPPGSTTAPTSPPLDAKQFFEHFPSNKALSK